MVKRSCKILPNAPFLTQIMCSIGGLVCDCIGMILCRVTKCFSLILRQACKKGKH